MNLLPSTSTREPTSNLQQISTHSPTTDVGFESLFRIIPITVNQTSPENHLPTVATAKATSVPTYQMLHQTTGIPFRLASLGSRSPVFIVVVVGFDSNRSRSQVKMWVLFLKNFRLSPFFPRAVVVCSVVEPFRFYGRLIFSATATDSIQSSGHIELRFSS